MSDHKDTSVPEPQKGPTPPQPVADDDKTDPSGLDEVLESVDKEDIEYISDTSAAILMKSPRGGRLLIYAMLLALGSAIFWANLAKLDEITRGIGSVVPSSRLQVIQNLEGGILKDLFVQEGQHVKAGQPLLRLDDTQYTSTLREGSVEYYSDLAKAARLKAELSGESLIFPHKLKEHRDYVNREQSLYYQRTQSLNAELDIADKQISQSNHELSSARTQVEFLSTSYELGKKELELTEPLAKQGVVSQVELIQLRQRVNDLASEKRMTELSLPRLEDAYAETVARKEEVIIKFREKVAEELREVAVGLNQLTEAQAGVQDQVERTQVRSPMDGIVKKIHITTIGGIVQPGMDMMEIVPLEDTLLVETQVNPKDIGFLQQGMRAVVKLTAYDFAIYGGLEGKVEHISADTIKNDKGESFYIVRVRTNKNYVGTDTKKLMIIPGMQTNVDIITGEKTLMDYLMKPILKARQNALTER
ncbi:Type I secretion system membrane fusion protein PrsE [invertebrate metagenome]|uniref:Type I secretion system membrane fusion protein PrsE n=1 Tax=invertebrate metagenome TaxID=1711999 RepID=A0A2H9T6U9_9ZZZZ